MIPGVSEQEQARRWEYFRAVSGTNGIFVFLSMSAVVVSQFFFMAYGTLLTWVIPGALIFVFYIAASARTFLIEIEYREITENFNNYLILRLRGLIFPLLMLFVLRIPFLPIEFNPKDVELFLIIVFNAFFASFLVYPRWRERRLLSSRSSLREIDRELENEINASIGNQKSGRIRIFVAERKKMKIADAFQVGTSSPTIIVTDYLMENLTKGEFLAVLGHELGHFMNGDVKKNITANSLMFFGFFDVIFLLHYLFSFSFFLPGLIGLVALLYYFFRYAPAKRRNMELMADRYSAVNLGLKSDMISSLVKLDQLSFIPSNYYEGGTTSHPNVVTRIRALAAIDVGQESSADNSMYQ